MKQSINMLAAELAKVKRTQQEYASKHRSLMTEATQYHGYMEEAQAKIDDLEAALKLLEVNQGLVERSGKTS